MGIAYTCIMLTLMVFIFGLIEENNKKKGKNKNLNISNYENELFKKIIQEEKLIKSLTNNLNIDLQNVSENDDKDADLSLFLMSLDNEISEKGEIIYPENIKDKTKHKYKEFILKNYSSEEFFYLIFSCFSPKTFMIGYEYFDRIVENNNMLSAGTMIKNLPSNQSCKIRIYYTEENIKNLDEFIKIEYSLKKFKKTFFQIYDFKENRISLSELKKFYQQNKYEKMLSIEKTVELSENSTNLDLKKSIKKENDYEIDVFYLKANNFTKTSFIYPQDINNKSQYKYKDFYFENVGDTPIIELLITVKNDNTDIIMSYKDMDRIINSEEQRYYVYSTKLIEVGEKIKVRIYYSEENLKETLKYDSYSAVVDIIYQGIVNNDIVMKNLRVSLVNDSIYKVGNIYKEEYKKILNKYK